MQTQDAVLTHLGRVLRTLIEVEREATARMQVCMLHLAMQDLERWHYCLPQLAANDR